MNTISKCAKCDKIVYPLEKIDAGKSYHKACFRCMAEDCGVTLNLKTLQVSDGKIFCPKHVPSHKHTSMIDSVAVSHALNAPKKAAEGLHKTQLGTSSSSNFGLDSLSSKHAQNAPKKASEGLLKTYVGSSSPLSKNTSSPPLSDSQKSSTGNNTSGFSSNAKHYSADSKDSFDTNDTD